MFSTKDFRLNIKNIPGFRTKKKIVIIESDDWGSVNMSSNDAYNKLTYLGFDFTNNHFLNYDCLESNEDMELLFEVLSKHKDSTGRVPVMTGVNVVANPDFIKIKENDYSRYEYELFTETCKKYRGRERVYDFWKEGIEKRLFVPVFHGREHLNVQRWMKLLKNNDKTIHSIFEYGVPFVNKSLYREKMPNVRAAFDIDNVRDISYLKEVIQTGLDLFETLYGYRTRFFVPPNGPFNNSLEKDLFQNGIKYISTAKKQLEPLGNNKYRTNCRFIGKKNHLGQLYLTRNCFFEPSSLTHQKNTDWVNNCLKEIDTAFRWKKPATISSHRVNYVGSLKPENRGNGLNKLNQLLSQIIKKWSEVEFMTSEELGDLISQNTEQY